MRRLAHLARLLWSYGVARSTRLNHPPYQYTIEPTNICNLRCPFCPQSDPIHRRSRVSGFLSVEALESFLHHMHKAHPGNRRINFTLDGEPFLNPDFVRLIEIAAEAGLDCVFATNGTLMDPPAIDRMVAAGGFRASVDFAADREIFETIRGRKGDYDVVLANLRYLVDCACTQRRVRVDINDVAPFAGSEPGASLAQLRALFPRSLPSRVQVTSRTFHNFCGHLKMERDRSRYRLCPYPWTQMAVTHEGDCVACCRDTAARSVMGNVFRDGVMAVWNGARYQEFRQNLLDGHPERNAACKDCDLPWSAGSARWKPRYLLRSLLRR